MGVSDTKQLNEHCRPYPEQFSTTYKDSSIKESAFSIPKGRKVEKCNRNSPWKQDGSRCPVIDYGEAPRVIESLGQLSKEKSEFYSTPPGIVQLNKKGISLAVERRIALFFQQAILCYKMSSFTFSIGGADGQIGSSPALKLKGKVHKREAAHSSTIPSLIAYANDGSTPNGFI